MILFMLYTYLFRIVSHYLSYIIYICWLHYQLNSFSFPDLHNTIKYIFIIVT